MCRHVGRQHVVAAAREGAELLVHVRGLATAVQAEDGCQPAMAPLEVVDLTVADNGEAAAAAARHVVPWREIAGVDVGPGRRLGGQDAPAPISQAMLPS